MPPTKARSLSCMAAMACNSRPVSSKIRTSICDDKSPMAIRSATTTARPMGVVTLAVMRQAIRPPRTKAASTNPPSTANTWCCNAITWALAALLWARCSSINSVAVLRSRASAGRTRFIRVSTAATLSPSTACRMDVLTSGSTFWPACERAASNWRSCSVALAPASKVRRSCSVAKKDASSDTAAWISRSSCLRSRSANRAAERLRIPKLLMLPINW